MDPSSNVPKIFTQISTSVIYVIPSLSTGGAELQTINHVNFLHAQGTDVCLLVLSNCTRNISRVNLPDNRLKIYRDNHNETLGKEFVRNLFGIVRFLIRQISPQKKAHVVLVLEESHIAGRLLKFFRPKIIIHCYFRDVHYTPNQSIAVKLFDRVNNLLARMMDDSTFFISEAVKQDIEKKFYTTNPLTVPNSLPNIHIDDRLGTEYLKENNLFRPYLILFPGRLHEKKGHLKFLMEFHQFCQNEGLHKNDVGLILAGNGPEKPAIENKIAELDLNEIVFPVGELPYEVLLSLYKCCDIVVIPSIREGFGNVAIEGLLQQALMLVSNVDGLSEIIRDGYNGFTYDINIKGEGSERLSFLYQRRNEQLIDPGNLSQDFKRKYSLKNQMIEIIQHLMATEKRKNLAM